MTLDELSIRFTADISAFSAAMASLTGLIGAANAQVDGMAAHFQAAGASAGAGLSSGILSQQGGGGRGGPGAGGGSLCRAAGSAANSFSLPGHL